MDKVTPKQGMFIAEYLVDMNGTRAAIAVGVPEKSAAVTAARWLKNRRIASVIAQRQARRVERLEDEAERIDAELRRLAFVDAGRLYDGEGFRLPVHLLDEDTRRAVASVEEEITEGPAFVTTRRQKIKMADKLRAIELLGKRRGLFTDNVNHSGQVTLEQLVTGAAGADEAA